MSLVIGILTFILIITSLFLVLVVLMQRAKTDGGMGSAMGGGSMESTFGAETGNVLSGATIKAAIVFFVVSFTLYLAHIYQAKHHDSTDNRLPTITAPASTAPGPVPVTAVPSKSAGPVSITTVPASGPVPLKTAPSAGPTPQPTPQPVEPKKP
jgi:preprotein translocase subunit SecG